MRKVMTKEVTKTLVKVAKMEMVDGLPQAVTLPDETLLGNVSAEKAQKEIQKKYDYTITVFSVQAETHEYQMPVEEFIKHATIKSVEPKEENEVA